MVDLRLYQRILQVRADRGHTLSGGPCETCGDLDGCWFRECRSVYVASSWRNDVQPFAVKALRDRGLDVYDFREDGGFRWSSIDPEWETWTPEQFVEALSHPLAKEGYMLDYEAMLRSDACLMVQPCGVSAALEAAWFAGHGRPVAVLLQPGPRFEPELMLGLLNAIHTTMEDAVVWASSVPVRRNPASGRWL